MKSVSIYVFSGTGNTLLAARAMRDRFKARGVDAELKPIETSDPSAIDLSRTTGLACPVAMQSTYPIVWNFIRNLPPGKGAGFFLMDTLRMFSGGIVGPVRGAIGRKGYQPLGALEIVMPVNMLRPAPFNDADRALIEKALDKAAWFADCLADGKAQWPRPRLWEWLFLGLARFSFRISRLTMGAFGPSLDAAICEGCGLCAKLCPAKAIAMADGKPKFSRNCQLCMRCLSYCPVNAIKLFRKTFAPYRPVKAKDFSHAEL